MTLPYDPAALDRLIDEALDLPPAERPAFLEARTADQPALRAAAWPVLREASAADGFLQPDSPGAVALRDIVLGEDDDDRPALAPGDVFTTLEVVGFVGRGGMGEVYRAKDARLGRHVALKVLPRAVVNDPMRLARFEREARMLGSLNHPNIGAIYGLAEDAGRQALVLEFVEGATLADMIQQGPLPIRDALAIARQVALALETAHRRGIVHRDLKPSNIAVTDDGTVKVLDFGLAKAARREENAGDSSLTGSVAPGAIVGTPAYMAPEQVQGLPVDQRADTWAFGCILFEMLAGVRAFPGDTTGDTLAGVLQREPDFTQLPPLTPEALRRLLRQTLVKDPQHRPEMAGALTALDAAAVGASARPGRLALAATVIGLLAVGALTGVLDWRSWTRSEAPVVRFAIPIAASDQLLPSGQQMAALSPDGQTLVYRAIRGGQVNLFRRRVGELASEPIPGTTQAAGPFFSSDGAWIGFDGDGVLQKVPLAGGSPVTICKVSGGADASWAGSLIVFSTAVSRVLHRVDAGGGSPEPLTSLDRGAGEVAHTSPFVLPRADAVLFTIVTDRETHVAALRFDGGEVRRLTPGAQPRLAAGHLVFVRNEALWAAPFDDRSLTLLAEPRPVLEGLDTTGGTAAHFAIANDGTLVYAPRREDVPERAVVWVDRRGAETQAPVDPKRYARATLSPDGRRVALAASESGNTDLWVVDLESGRSMRLTRDPTSETAPLWSPDGRFLVFRSDRDGGGLFRQRADGLGPVERLTASQGTLHTPHGFTPDGAALLFTAFRSYTEQAIEAVDVERPLVTRPLVGGAGAQLRPTVSPDGRWLAYQSDDSGQFEIYVSPYPDVHRSRVQVSQGGGTSPRWSHDGRTLYYYDGRGLTSLAIRPGDNFALAGIERLFAYAPFGGRLGPDFDPSPDGTRFLFIRPASDTPSSRVQLLVVQNWFSELRKPME